MRLGTAFAVLLGALVLAGLGGCSKKPAPAPIVTPPVTRPTETPVTPPPTPPVPEKATAVIRLQDAFFDFDQSELLPEARNALTQDADYLMQNPGLRVTIEGHCDERGTNEYNLALGDRRARAARDFLVRYGIEVSRIETISYGEERPFATGHDESAWSQNRRAHFVER